MSCPSCGIEIGGETVIDDRGVSATTSNSDTAPNGNAILSDTSLKSPGANDLHPFVERTDEEMDPQTSILPRGKRIPAPTPLGGSSSDPPTRLLRGVDQHIELPAGSVVDDFEVDARLGAGAMGVVYSARHVKLGRRVALKVIAPSMGADPQALARFEREARALASLHHPNIVDVYTFGTLADERSYFAMEFLSGEALDERLARGRVPIDEALDVVDQIARALEAAHAQGIVHRDLKPSNTFLQRVSGEQRAVVKLLDFGLVRLAVADGVERTASGAVIGTALYISPEQARSPSVDGRTDIYALGVVTFELVLGQHPFPDARTATAALAAHLTEPPPQPRTIWPEIPPALDLLMHAMLAKDPNYRPTLAQVRSVIASVRSATTPMATAGRSARAATEFVTRGAPYSRTWIVAMVAFALLVGIAIGANALGGRSSRGGELRAQPATYSATSGSGGAAALGEVDPTLAAVAPNRVVDAGVPPDRAPTSEMTRTSTSPVAATPNDAAITDAAAPPTGPAHAALTHETSTSPRESATKSKSRAVSPPLTPAAVAKPAQRPVPPPPVKPPDRNDTINPFAKRGSAAR